MVLFPQCCSHAVTREIIEVLCVEVIVHIPVFPQWCSRVGALESHRRASNSAGRRENAEEGLSATVGDREGTLSHDDDRSNRDILSAS